MPGRLDLGKGRAADQQSAGTRARRAVPFVQATPVTGDREKRAFCAAVCPVSRGGGIWDRVSPATALADPHQSPATGWIVVGRLGSVRAFGARTRPLPTAASGCRPSNQPRTCSAEASRRPPSSGFGFCWVPNSNCRR